MNATKRSQAYAAILPQAGDTFFDMSRGSVAERNYLRHSLSQNLNSMLSMMGRDIHTIFSAPEFIRQDGQTIVWQYRNERCVLDVYFTLTVPDEADATILPVSHYEFRARSSDYADFDAYQCARSLKQVNRFL